MFKIIKTSTYKRMSETIARHTENLKLYTDTMLKASERILELEIELHLLTAKKLPITKPLSEQKVTIKNGKKKIGWTVGEKWVYKPKKLPIKKSKNK